MKLMDKEQYISNTQENFHRFIGAYLSFRLAPNKEVIAAKWWKPSPDDRIANKANRRQQIRYALLDGNPEDFVIQKLEIDVDEIADYVYECIGRLNKFTHISSAYFGCPENEIPLRVSEACSTITN